MIETEIAADSEPDRTRTRQSAGTKVGLPAVLLLAWLVGAPLAADPPHYTAARQGGQYMHNYYLPPAPSASPWMPCWSPDGKWIAVSFAGSIWKIAPGSGEAFELTAGPTYHSSPAWSPDGRWIVYTSDDDMRGIQLGIVNVETGAERWLTSDQSIYADPVFSPDGTRLAYVSTGDTGYFKIYYRPIRGGDWNGDPVLLTPDHRNARDRGYVGGWDMHTQPAWTPDGREIVFVSNRDVAMGSGDLWRMPAEPDGMGKAVRILREQSYYRTRPHVSPDGARLIYASQAGGADQFNNLYVLPISGGMPVKYTFGAFHHFHPRWSPDGESIAFIASQDATIELCVLETNGGGLKRVRFTARHYKRPMGRVRVRVVDAATGRPTAARIQDAAADGKFYAPPEAYARVSGQSRHCFFSHGEFEMDVPAGDLTLEAVKGYEYRPASAKVHLAAGQTASVVLRLQRMTDMAARGWYPSSTHVHMNYGGNLLNTPESLALAAAAEHVRIVNADIANADNRLFDYQYFAGAREYPLHGTFPEVKITFGEEYRSQFYGHVYLAGLRDHVILPYGTAFEGALGSLVPTNADMLRKAKAEGAVTGYVHPFGETDPLESGLGAKAFPVDAALGLVDTLDWAAALRGPLKVWFRMLNNDFRIAPTGGEDSIVDLHNRKLIGSIRTYAYLGKEFSVEAWYEALRKGRTFFSTGPLIEFKVNGKLPGEQIDLPAAGAVTVEATVWSVAPLAKITLHHGRGVLKEFTPAATGPTRIREQVTIASSDWLVLTAEGAPTPALDASFLLAGANAVRVYVGGGRIRSREDARYFLKWIDKLAAMTDAWPWWRSAEEKKHVFAQYEDARQIYRRLADEDTVGR